MSLVILVEFCCLQFSFHFINSSPSPGVELQTNLHKDLSFTITEKAPTGAFSWLKAPTLELSHLRHYAKAKRVLTNGK